MDYKLFWELNPKKLEVFVKAFKQKAEYESNKFKAEANFSAWLSGFYVCKAISANFAKNTVYFEKPISLEKEEINQAALFEAWAVNYNQKFKRRRENG